MQVFKTADSKFSVINGQLKEGKELASRGEKMVKNGKAAVLTWLKSERGLDIEAEPAGTIVLIQLDGVDCIKLERKGRNAVDLTRLANERPEIAAEFTASRAATYIEAL